MYSPLIEAALTATVKYTVQTIRPVEHSRAEERPG